MVRGRDKAYVRVKANEVPVRKTDRDQAEELEGLKVAEDESSAARLDCGAIFARSDRMHLHGRLRLLVKIVLACAAHQHPWRSCLSLYCNHF